MSSAFRRRQKRKDFFFATFPLLPVRRSRDIARLTLRRESASCLENKRKELRSLSQLCPGDWQPGETGKGTANILWTQALPKAANGVPDEGPSSSITANTKCQQQK